MTPLAADRRQLCPVRLTGPLQSTHVDEALTKQWPQQLAVNTRLILLLLFLDVCRRLCEDVKATALNVLVIILSSCV